VPLSTQVYEWLPTNLILGVALQWASIPSKEGKEILIVATCFRNWDRFWPDEPLGLYMYADLITFT